MLENGRKDIIIIYLQRPRINLSYFRGQAIRKLVKVELKISVSEFYAYRVSLIRFISKQPEKWISLYLKNKREKFRV